MCKTLIVEDSPFFRRMLKGLLGNRFPRMTIAEERDGSELFPKIDSFHPDIVFMDIRLPGESGLELTKRIKMKYPEIVVVLLTNYDLPEYKQAATQSKVDYFITKDSPARNFLALVESIAVAKNAI